MGGGSERIAAMASEVRGTEATHGCKVQPSACAKPTSAATHLNPQCNPQPALPPIRACFKRS
eukprot:12542561-Alexandrium_andersonii.AAC.1